MKFYLFSCMLLLSHAYLSGCSLCVGTINDKSPAFFSKEAEQELFAYQQSEQDQETVELNNDEEHQEVI